MEYLSVDKANGVATVAFHRPPVNALTKQVLRDVIVIFDGFADDREVSVAAFRAVPDRGLAG